MLPMQMLSTELLNIIFLFSPIISVPLLTYFVLCVFRTPCKQKKVSFHNIVLLCLLNLGLVLVTAICRPIIILSNDMVMTVFLGSNWISEDACLVFFIIHRFLYNHIILTIVVISVMRLLTFKRGYIYGWKLFLTVHAASIPLHLLETGRIICTLLHRDDDWNYQAARYGQLLLPGVKYNTFIYYELESVTSIMYALELLILVIGTLMVFALYWKVVLAHRSTKITAGRLKYSVMRDHRRSMRNLSFVVFGLLVLPRSILLIFVLFKPRTTTNQLIPSYIGASFLPILIFFVFITCRLYRQAAKPRTIQVTTTSSSGKY